MQNFVSLIFSFVFLCCFVGCYPNTLRQQMAGCDTIEIIFLDNQDTLVIAQKKYIKGLLSNFSEQPQYSLEKKHPINAKIIFKKARRGYVMLEGELALNPSCAYITYEYGGKQLYRTLLADSVDFLDLARNHKFFFEQML